MPRFQATAQLHNATPGLDVACQARYEDSGAWRCFLAQYALSFVQTPVFALNSVYDRWQAVNILNVSSLCLYNDATCSQTEVAAMNGLRMAILSNISSNVPTIDATSGYFLWNCATHCGQFTHDR